MFSHNLRLFVSEQSAYKTWILMRQLDAGLLFLYRLVDVGGDSGMSTVLFSDLCAFCTYIKYNMNRHGSHKYTLRDWPLYRALNIIFETIHHSHYSFNSRVHCINFRISGTARNHSKLSSQMPTKFVRHSLLLIIEKYYSFISRVSVWLLC